MKNVTGFRTKWVIKFFAESGRQATKQKFLSVKLKQAKTKRQRRRSFVNNSKLVSLVDYRFFKIFGFRINQILTHSARSYILFALWYLHFSVLYVHINKSIVLSRLNLFVVSSVFIVIYVMYCIHLFTTVIISIHGT